ncbi:MAG: glycosyltransferase family 4 protein [Bacteroides sp.]|uniref:glycosyltransferase family 4 protein n=1 Tax=Bacteroides sp. TaxID=29523 RepID=UPI002FCC2857
MIKEQVTFSKSKNRVLILVPPLCAMGGISLHFKGLKKYWIEDIQYYETYKESNPNVFSIFKLLWNYIYFITKIIIKKPNIVVVNISLKKGFVSKNIYILLAKLLHCKIVSFIHGWDKDYEWMLATPKGKQILNSTDAFIVLSEQFKNKLENSGVKVNILISTTKVDNSLLEKFDINWRNGSIKNFLFLSRIERSKGIFLALDIFKMLQKDYPKLSFNIAGQGTAINEVKQYISEKNIKNVDFLGRVDGDSLSKAFINSDCFFLLSETEGMPAALLEALSFGMPAITMPVGGIPDFFVDGKMGIMSEETTPYYYYDRIKEMINNPLYVKEVCFYNYTFAKTHFYASTVARNLENYFNNL